MIQDFKKDFTEMCSLIEGDRPFAFMRFADGEVGVMSGRGVVGVDNWTSPNFITKLGKELQTAISLIDDDVYYGISCGCCSVTDRDYLLSLIKNPRSKVTYSNLFVNGNYNAFVQFLKSLSTGVYVIANESAQLQNFPLEVVGYMPVPNNCVAYWEQFEENIKQYLDNTFGTIKNELVLVSAGPMSEAIISYLWTTNPHNKYVDVGSAIGEFVHGRPIREFAYPQSPYHNKDCVF